MINEGRLEIMLAVQRYHKRSSFFRMGPDSFIDINRQLSPFFAERAPPAYDAQGRPVRTREAPVNGDDWKISATTTYTDDRAPKFEVITAKGPDGSTHSFEYDNIQRSGVLISGEKRREEVSLYDGIDFLVGLAFRNH